MPILSYFTPAALVAENEQYAGTAGCSAGNQSLGFRPAFLDSATDAVYPSRFADGRPAPIHVLDGLPQHLVAERAPNGRVRAASGSVVAGFIRDWRFYTREEALHVSDAEAEEMPLVSLSNASNDQTFSGLPALVGL
jgi:hypothetical protein